MQREDYNQARSEFRKSIEISDSYSARLGLQYCSFFEYQKSRDLSLLYASIEEGECALAFENRFDNHFLLAQAFSTLSLLEPQDSFVQKAKKHYEQSKLLLYQRPENTVVLEERINDLMRSSE